MFRVLLGVGKRRVPFSQLPWPRPGLPGAPVPLPHPHPPPPIHPTTTLLSPSHSGCSLLTFKSEPPFLALHKYISLSKHSFAWGFQRDPHSARRASVPQPFGLYKCTLPLSNLPVLIFALKRCVHTCKAISVKHQIYSGSSLLQVDTSRPPQPPRKEKKKI